MTRRIRAAVAAGGGRDRSGISPLQELAPQLRLGTLALLAGVAAGTLLRVRLRPGYPGGSSLWAVPAIVAQPSLGLGVVWAVAFGRLLAGLVGSARGGYGWRPLGGALLVDTLAAAAAGLAAPAAARALPGLSPLVGLSPLPGFSRCRVSARWRLSRRCSGWRWWRS